MYALLDLILRWLHVIAAIMWIGNSLLFNWLDRNLKPAAEPRDRSMGEIWLLHSGGFYQMEKTLALGSTPARSVHWFKWQAYTTWLSGAALLIVVYYLNVKALLRAPDAAINDNQAVALSLAVLAGGVLCYQVIWRTPLKRFAAVTSALCFALLLALTWWLAQLFTGRATFLHIGALLGTIMASNVMFHIMPSQRGLVAAIERGEPADERLSQRAKLHSIHNNYITFPVIALMLSSHFPELYAPDRGWIALAVLCIGGAAVRHVLNIRFAFRQWIPTLAATIALGIAGLYLVAFRPASTAPATAYQGEVTFDQAFAIVQKRCAVCHSMSPADRSFGAPPVGVALETPDQVRSMAVRIEARAVISQTMPPANSTNMTPEERAMIGAWVRSGAK